MGDFSKTVTYVKSDDQAPFPTCPECDSQIKTGERDAEVRGHKRVRNRCFVIT